MSRPLAEAFVARTSEGGEVTCAVEPIAEQDLGEGDVLVRVLWSGINFKDVLASSTGGKVARLDVLVPGIDLAGEVVYPGSSGLKLGDPVVVHGYALGVSHHGGYSQLARVPADWLVPLPAGLSAREAMVLGTAGFTAAAAITQLEERGLRPGAGPVLVTGASGGVGSLSVGMLANLGYEVVASTGNEGVTGWLKDLGATQVVGREEVQGSDRPLTSERWAGVVDCVGGATLSGALKALRYGGAAAATGNTGGNAFDATVLPFILRGAALLGVDSVNCDPDRRRELWRQMATRLRPPGLADVAEGETTLSGLAGSLDRVRRGEVRGRTLVRLES